VNLKEDPPERSEELLLGSEEPHRQTNFAILKTKAPICKMAALEGSKQMLQFEADFEELVRQLPDPINSRKFQ